MTRLLLLAGAALALSACSYTEVEREIGYKGPARVNPWLAAERFAARMDRPVRSVISWTDPQPGDALWLLPASILSNESFTRRMEQWVTNGGHLIVLVEHADEETNDWADDPPPPVLEPALLAMLQRAGIHLHAPVAAKDHVSAEKIRFAGRVYQVEARSGASVSVRKQKPGVFASVAAGMGRVTVVTDGRMFRNRWISEPDHAALFAALLRATPATGAVGFMRGSGLSLWVLLRQQLWPVLLAGALWVVLWLWKNLTRFGPLAAAEPAVLRGYEHHLEALGDFQWRLDRAASLLARLRLQIVESGQRAGADDGDFPGFLATRAGLPRERVVRALAGGAPADAAQFTRLTADLQQLLKVLHHPS